MKILILAQLFDPEPTFKGLSFAQELRRQGHEVEILTALPNYPEGKLYAGYKSTLCQSEKIDGLQVWRTYVYPSHDRSGFRRALTYLSFATSARYIGVKKVSVPDVIYIYNLVTLVAAATYLRHKYGSKIVLDLQDPWPDSIQNSGMLKIPKLEKLLTSYCTSAYMAVDSIICSTPGYREDMKRRNIPDSKLDLIYRWTDNSLTRETEPLTRKQLGLPENFLILFAGTMGTSQDIDSILDAAKICMSKHLDISFVFVGGGTEVERLSARKRNESIDNVFFLSRQPISKIRDLLDTADALLVHLRDTPLFRISIPSKTEAYLSIGKPILMAAKGNARDIVEQAEAGMSCEPESPEAIANAAQELSQLPREKLLEMGSSGKQFYQSTMSMQAGIQKFLAVFQKLMN